MGWLYLKTSTMRPDFSSGPSIDEQSDAVSAEIKGAIQKGFGK